MAEDVATSSPEQASQAPLPPAPPPEVGSRPASARVRNRLARLGGQRPNANPVLDPLLRTVRANHPKLDVSIVERAYAVAEHFHEGQLRKSGDPYITHPLAVATILAELGMTGPRSVTAVSCARAATPTSPTRSPSRRSSPSWAWTPRRSSPPCCTTRSRTPG